MVQVGNTSALQGNDIVIHELRYKGEAKRGSFFASDMKSRKYVRVFCLCRFRTEAKDAFYFLEN